MIWLCLILQFVPPSQPTTNNNQLPTSVQLPKLEAVEGAKRLAAFAAVDKHVGLKDKVSCCMLEVLRMT